MPDMTLVTHDICPDEDVNGPHAMCLFPVRVANVLHDSTAWTHTVKDELHCIRFAHMHDLVIHMHNVNDRLIQVDGPKDSCPSLLKDKRLTIALS